MSLERRRRAAFAIFGLILLSWIANAILSWNSISSGSSVLDGAFAVVLLTFPVVGLLITSRMPDNTIGWLLLAIGLAWGTSFGSGYAEYGGSSSRLGTLPGAAAAAAIGQGQWVLPVGLTGMFLLLLYPDGRLPSPRWRWVARVSAAAIVLASVGIAISPGHETDAGYAHTVNPLGISAIPKALLVLPIVLVPLSIGACAVSLIVRFRRSRGIERLQLKWLMAAAAVVAGVYLVIFPFSILLSQPTTPGWLDDVQNVFSLTFCLIPIAIGFAVLRRGLYGIDLIIRRTVLYAGVVVVLGALYIAAIWAVGTSLRSLTDRSDTVAVTLSTLLVFAIFQPVRIRVQRSLDHRFYRAKYDAQAAIDMLSRTLAQQVDLDSVEREVLALVAGTLQPVHVGLWIRPQAVTIPGRPPGTTEGR